MDKTQKTPNTEKPQVEITSENVKSWVKADLKAAIVFLDMVYADQTLLDLMVDRLQNTVKIGAAIDAQKVDNNG